MPNIHLKCKTPKSCETCRFNRIVITQYPNARWCILLDEELIMPKILKRKKNCPFNKKKTILSKIIKEIEKCLKLKKKPKSLM